MAKFKLKADCNEPSLQAYGYSFNKGEGTEVTEENLIRKFGLYNTLYRVGRPPVDKTEDKPAKKVTKKASKKTVKKVDSDDTDNVLQASPEQASGSGS